MGSHGEPLAPPWGRDRAVAGRAHVRLEFTRANVVDALARESLLVVGVVVVIGVLIWRLPAQLNQDGWLALVAGRDIVSHGIPHTDVLTIWAEGHTWVDQQWLAQAAFYGLYVIGGIAALAVAHAVMTGCAYALAVAAARRLGGSPRGVLFLIPFAFPGLVTSTWQIRTQSFAYVLFVTVLYLLARDSRSPGYRVYMVLPLLVVWANVHGSVVLAVGLVVLRGLLACRPGSAGRSSAALVVLAPLTLLATPYGLDVLSYYKSTLANPAFGAMVNEWQAPTLTLVTAPFFVLAGGTLWVLGRSRRSLTLFEQLALLLTCVAGLMANRNIGRFAFTAVMLVPRALDDAERRPVEPRLPAATLHAAVAVAASLVVVCLLIRTADRPAAFFGAPFPDQGARTVARLAREDPSATIYADVKYADWLLWREPALSGRIAFDARFELLSPRRLYQIYNFDNLDGEPWRAPTHGFAILVLDGTVSQHPISEMRGRKTARVVYASHGMIVMTRRARA